MNSNHVLDQLPLWVEGDLPEREAMSIQAHLATCESCRAASEALQASQEWLKNAPAAPFEAADYALLRRDVMARIRAHPQASLWDRIRSRMIFHRAPILLAASAVVLLVALSGWTRNRSRETGSPAQPILAARVAAPPSVSIPPAQPTLAGARPLRIRHLAEAAPESAEQVAGQGPARIEIQTSNPRIRIIWLAQALPARDPLEQPHHPS